MILILMGVSGSGKSTIGEILSQRLGWPFHDGDHFHPPANIAKMRQGIPLNDQDRQPWLETIRDFMKERQARGESAIIACSALRHSYRQVLLQGEPWVRFAWLRGDRDLIAHRMQSRAGHFMPPSLLDSQLQTLEPPSDAWVVDISPPPGEVAESLITRLHATSPAAAQGA